MPPSFAVSQMGSYPANAQTNLAINHTSNLEQAKTANHSPMLNSDLTNGQHLANNKYVLEPITEDKALNTPNRFSTGIYHAKRANNYRPSKTI